MTHNTADEPAGGALEALVIKGLYKSYGGFSVSFDMTAGPGETLALVGPSGSGKTSALNLIAGLAISESGSIAIGSKDITGLPPWKRNISVVFQDLALFPHLDVGGNIAYGLFIKGVSKKERERVVAETLETVRLPGFSGRRIHTLSGGERQRVAIARALASNPAVLLLDEPFSSLDAPLRRNLRRDFLEIRSASRAPCVFVTHDREEAVMLGDRIALMENGRVSETGTGRELLFEPKTESAARFFGAGEVLPCEIIEETGTFTAVSSALGTLKIPRGRFAARGRQKLFVPHDAITFEDDNVPFGLKAFTGIFRGAIFEGQSMVLKFTLPGTENGYGSEDDFDIEVRARPRVKVPSQNSKVKLRLDESLARLVTPNAEPNPESTCAITQQSV